MKAPYYVDQIERTIGCDPDNLPAPNPAPRWELVRDGLVVGVTKAASPVAMINKSVAGPDDANSRLSLYNYGIEVMFASGIGAAGQLVGMYRKNSKGGEQ